ncbi:MAG TPA: YtxH domain-containing protein [Thermoanaerobaculia bacterium]
MFEKKFPWTKVAISFVLGIAGGAVTALLFAPMTGRKLRKQLEDVVENQVDNVEKLVKKVVNA